jgi:hypothetical protein
VIRALAIGFTFGTVMMLLVQPFTRVDLIVTMIAASAACFFWTRTPEAPRA